MSRQAERQREAERSKQRQKGDRLEMEKQAMRSRWRDTVAGRSAEKLVESLPPAKC